jgi:ceramide glucosyltransferase
VYPGPVETIFVFDDRAEPGLPLARKAIEAHEAGRRHGRARIIIAGPPPADRTGKLNAMIAGLAEARGELVAFGDSDTRPDPLVLRQVVDKLLASPGAGAAFAPVVMLTKPQSAGDIGAALMLNGLYGPAVADTVVRRGSMPFIMGQLMVLRRKALEALGNLQALSGHLVDDMQIGVRLTTLGFRNVVAPHTLPVVIQGLRLGDFARMFRRWLIFSRSGLPMNAFKGRVWMRGLEFWLGLLLAVSALVFAHPLSALAPAIVPALVLWSMVRLHRKLGGAPLPLRHVWVLPAILLAGPFAVLSALLWPRVTWRGRSYRLDARSRLAENTAQTKQKAAGVRTPRSVSARRNLHRR